MDVETKALSDALNLAIESMRFRRVDCELLAADWRKYGGKLAFRRDEARRTAQLFDRLTAAIEQLEAIRATLRSNEQ